MSQLYSQMQSIAESGSRAAACLAGNEPVQRELKTLLRQLNWSYVALWTFNHRTSRLEWSGGHFRVHSSAVASPDDTEIWNERMFNSIYSSCTFASGQGYVGTASAEARSIWMNGPSARQSAGSKEQAQVLQHARIETVVSIPWAENVLEIGTTATVDENMDLMAYMCIVLSEHILPSVAQAPPNVSHSSLGASRAMIQPDPFAPLSSTRHLSHRFLNQEFELTPLNEQIRRSSSLSSLNADMFLQPDEGEAWNERSIGLDTGNVFTGPRCRSPTTTTAADIQLQTQRPPLPASNPALMSVRMQQSGTTSSSVSISEEGSVRLSPSPRRGTPSHSPEVQIPDSLLTTGIIIPTQNLRVEDELQQAMSHMLEEGEAGVDTQEQWRNVYMNPALEHGDVVSEMNVLDSRLLPSTSGFHAQELPQPAFKSWQPAHVQGPVLRRNNSTNQALLRRCIDMLKQLKRLQHRIRPEAAVVQTNISLEGPRLTSSPTNPEVLRDIRVADDSFDQTAPLKGQRRPRGARAATTGPVLHANPDGAAMNHVMAERRRRVKQKEYFSALRKLVPIISKADKASILGDAIAYIKEMQETVRALESSNEQAESRYENQKKAHQELQQRNKELEAMLAVRNGAGPSHMRQHRSAKSITPCKSL